MSKHYTKCRDINVNQAYSHEECGDRRSRLYVKFLGNRWTWYCHNCGKHGVWWDRIRPPSETLRRIHYPLNDCPSEPVSTKRLALPLDITFKYPEQAIRWLKPTGLTDAELQQYKIVWSDRWNRLILPIYQGDELVYYQARTFDPISPSNPKYRNVRQLGVKTVYFRRTCPESTAVVLVEDILSAIKVGRQTNTIALLGSYVPDDLITNVIGQFSKVYIWLDYDKLSTAYAYMKRIKSLIPTPVKIIITKEDPKFCNDSLIRSKLI